MSLRVTLLGTGVGIPQKDRSQSSLLIRARDPLLLDCGAGTLLRLSEAGVDVLDLDAVFLTHLHLDHVADLLPLANARYLMAQALWRSTARRAQTSGSRLCTAHTPTWHSLRQ
jgi:ribonuclease Z